MGEASESSWCARVYREGIARSDGGTSYVRARLTHAKGCWMGFFPTNANNLTAGQAVWLEARRFRHKVADDGFLIERWTVLPVHQERFHGERRVADLPAISKNTQVNQLSIQMQKLREP